MTYDIIKRIARICAKNTSSTDKSVQTFKEMSDEYVMELKVERQEELITEQNHKIDDMESRLKLKN